MTPAFPFSNPHLIPLLDRLIQSDPFPELSSPYALEIGIRESCYWMQRCPFKTTDLILYWFPILQKRWNVAEDQILRLSPALIDAGYTPVGDRSDPTWHWCQGDTQSPLDSPDGSGEGPCCREGEEGALRINCKSGSTLELIMVEE